ncbi:hydroxymethylpyrimidine/phosphomethylpyrimidine kinase [Arachidicoccus rhizosphaerae]|uniref:Hydroxymethylpyrimidine/phosphomethylpyrimidine kinase n=1 Tax=Arachidicoccus rhizosphaerae TaxID=551991 RepID=A0A1H3Z099_9BACT|nr:bifunctional hydroxymethylpyrimidine kinase/phosphomethylpyrimidine kinase [Arachidicoccus rhizosphaerae]SEA16754.1 hydroxymethylpyrimidine/phosphomethylpyrimidine kinase [Arachidicoccus rhizosphaerae]
MGINGARLTDLKRSGIAIPFVLSIGGMDPSGGAGLLSDIKTFESCGVYGLGIMSCNTVQTDCALYHIHWESSKRMVAALEKLQNRYFIRAVKVGAMQDFAMLREVVNAIRGFLPDARIAWDPVLKASAGPCFFYLSEQDRKGQNKTDWQNILNLIDVITPNAHEAIILGQLLGLSIGPDSTPTLSALNPCMEHLARVTSVLLKGGHLSEGASADWLFEKSSCLKQGIQVVHGQGRSLLKEKHGSGCVHSSVLTAMLAKNKSLKEAAFQAKCYIEEFLQSTELLLGLHGRLPFFSVCPDNFY